MYNAGHTCTLPVSIAVQLRTVDQGTKAEVTIFMHGFDAFCASASLNHGLFYFFPLLITVPTFMQINSASGSLSAVDDKCTVNTKDFCVPGK